MFEDGISQQSQQSKKDIVIPPLQLEQLNFSELYEDIEFKQLSRQKVSNSLYAETMVKQPLFCFFARILDIMQVTIIHSRHLCNWGILNNILDYIRIEHRVLAGLLLVAQSTASKVSFTNALFRLQRILTGIAELRQRAIIIKDDNQNSPDTSHEVKIDMHVMQKQENQKGKTKDANKISPSVLSNNNKSESIRKLSKGKEFHNSPQLNESESELVSATYEILFYAHKYSAAFLSGQNPSDAEKQLLKELGLNDEKQSHKYSFSSSKSKEKQKETDNNILNQDDEDLEKEQKTADNERDLITNIFTQSQVYLQTQEKRINRKKLSSLDLGQNITETIESFAKRLSEDQSYQSCSCPANSCSCNCKMSSNSGSNTPTTQYSPFSSAIMSHRSRSVYISSSSINTPKSRIFHSPSIYASNQPSGFELTTAPGAQYQQSLKQLFQEQQEQVNYHLRGLIHPSIKTNKPQINIGIDDHSSSSQPISEELPNDQEDENENGIFISKNPIWSGNHQQLLHFPQNRNQIGLRKKAHSYAMPVMRAVQEEKEDNEGYNSVNNDNNLIRSSLSAGGVIPSARPSLKRSSTSSQFSPTILREPKLSISSQSDIDGMEFPQKEIQKHKYSSKTSSSKSSIIRQNEEDQDSQKQEKIKIQQSNSSTSSSSSSSSPSSSSSSPSSSSSSKTSSNNSQEHNGTNPKSQPNPFVPSSNLNQKITFRRGGIHTKTVKKHMTQGGREFNTLGVVVPNFSFINRLTKKEEERDRYFSKNIHQSIKQPEELSLDWLHSSHKSESFAMETIQSNHNSQDNSTIDFNSLPLTDSLKKTQRDSSVESITEQSLITSKPRNNTIFQRIINFFHKPDQTKSSISPPSTLNNSEMDNFPGRKLLSPYLISSQNDLSSKKIIKKGIQLNGITFLRIKDLQIQEIRSSKDTFASPSSKSQPQLFLSNNFKLSTTKIAASSLYFANSQPNNNFSINKMIPTSPCIQMAESPSSNGNNAINTNEDLEFEKELADMFPHTSCQEYDIQDRKNNLLNFYGKASQQRIVQKKACLNYKELSLAIEENCDKHLRKQINKVQQNNHNSNNLDRNVIQEKAFFCLPKEAANYLIWKQEEQAKTKKIRIASQMLSFEAQIITGRLTLWSKLRIQVWRRIFYFRLYKNINKKNSQIQLIDFFSSSCLKKYLSKILSSQLDLDLNWMMEDNNNDTWMSLSRKSLKETIHQQNTQWNHYSAFL